MEGWKDIDSRDFNENALFRSYGRFACLLHAHICNINMHMYLTSARGHELSGRVHAHAYNYAWVCIANKLLITTA